MDVQWADMLRLLGSRRPSMLADIAAEVQESGGEPTTSRVDHGFRQQLLAADDATRTSLVQDYIRQELARIMGIDPASLETDQPLSTFGLDSLLALELKNNLESRLDFTLPMAKLMEGPSIASLAAVTSQLISSGQTSGGDSEAGAKTPADEDWSPILALQSNGTRPPLFLLPALGGDIRCYADLVQQLGDDQPVYAFRPRGVDQDLPPHATMEETVQDYIAGLREVQPTGPYHLAGWSAGGVLAFAIGEALERAGEDVGLLALFDAPFPSIFKSVTIDDDTRFLCELLTFASRFSGTNVEISFVELSRLAPEEQFPAALAEARKRGLIPMETPESFIRRLVNVGKANVRALQNYQPHRISTPVQLLVPAIKTALADLPGTSRTPEPDNGWASQLDQAVELHEVEGDHFTMMLGDNAAAIAQHLQRHLTAEADLVVS